LPKSLSGEGVTRSFKRVAKQSGIDIESISGHSTRVGACQDLVSAGIDMPAIMQAGGLEKSRTRGSLLSAAAGEARWHGSISRHPKTLRGPS